MTISRPIAAFATLLILPCTPGLGDEDDGTGRSPGGSPTGAGVPGGEIVLPDLVPEPYYPSDGLSNIEEGYCGPLVQDGLILQDVRLRISNNGKADAGKSYLRIDFRKGESRITRGRLVDEVPKGGAIEVRMAIPVEAWTQHTCCLVDQSTGQVLADWPFMSVDFDVAVNQPFRIFDTQTPAPAVAEHFTVNNVAAGQSCWPLKPTANTCGKCP